MTRLPLLALLALVGCSSPAFDIAPLTIDDDAGNPSDVLSLDVPPDTSPAPDVAPLEASPPPLDASPAEASPDAPADAHDAPAPPPDTFASPDADPCPTHANGLGQSFRYCAPLGAYSEALATAAANAWPETGEITPSACGTSSACVVKRGGTSCVVWCYSGELAGKVHQQSACWCPLVTDVTGWN